MTSNLTIQTVEERFAQIKKPVWYPERDRHGGSLWIVRSPKLQRKCHLQFELERDHWLLIEFNPDIVWFCEHPLKISMPVEGVDIGTIFDMLIKGTLMSRKDKGTKRQIERIEMDVTHLDILLLAKDGQLLPKPLLYVAMNPEDRLCGVGFTAQDAFDSLHEAYDEEE